jgi:ATP-binding cassette subfamily B protein/subfamily B ATP-binding cassette protein MsbA
VSVIRLVIAVAVLMALNWRPALAALAITRCDADHFIFAKRVRPIWRAVRKDAELIDGRVGETFSDSRRRAFRREVHGCSTHARTAHRAAQGTVAQRREPGNLDS